MERLRGPEDGEESCEMLSSEYVMTVTWMNSLELWLPTQDLHKICKPGAGEVDRVLKTVQYSSREHSSVPSIHRSQVAQKFL